MNVEGEEETKATFSVCRWNTTNQVQVRPFQSLAEAQLSHAQGWQMPQGSCTQNRAQA